MIWRLEYENAHGDVARLDIQRGAATPVEIIEGTEKPFLLSYELEDKSKKGFIMSSFADISIYETATFNIDDLKTLDETALSVKWYINSVLEWTGFVVPDFFSRTIGEPAIINLAASDRLNSLKDATLDGLSEYITLIDLAIACLAKTGLSLPLRTTIDFKAKSGQSTIDVMDVFAMSERLEDDKGKKISCFDTLRSILVLTNSTIRQRKGQWRIYNKIQHEAVAPTLNFDEVYQGAKRTIQPVLSSVGAFQEFGGNRELPPNNSFEKNDINWTKGGSPLFVTNFDNRDIIFGTATAPAHFGQATNQNQLINRNAFNSGATSLSETPYLKSVDIKIAPLEATRTSRADNVLMTVEINSKSAHQSIAHFAVVRFYDGVVDAYLANDSSWKSSFSTIDINYIQEDIGRGQGYEVEDITTIETNVGQDWRKDPSKYRIAVYILGVTRAESPTNRMAAIRSVKIIFPESSDFGKGILYRTDQIGNFSKKSDPDTTIFGDHIERGLNGYFYRYSKDDTSILRSPTGSNLTLFRWTTATDPTAGELPILQHVTRQMSRMFGVAHNVLSAVIDAKTFDPLAIVTNCAGEKYVIVYSVFDFLRSTVEVELQQIAYGSLQRRDFIFSYFGGGDGDGISSIGSVSGGGSSSGGGGSFLDKYFSFDEANDALVANVNLVSEKEIAAYFADGSIPSIFDNFPFATPESTGGIKAASTYQNGIRINSSGFLEVDPSYADSGVSSWNDLTDRPTWLTPTTKATFEAGHGHTIGNITGLQTVLDGKEPSFTKNTAFNKNFGTDAGTVAQGNDSRINNGQTAYGWGNHASIDYARKGQNETITGAWTINNNLRLGGGTTRNLYTGSMRIRDNGTGAWIISPESGAPARWYFRPDGDGAFTNTFFISQGGVGFGTEDPQERLHVVGNGLFTGNLSAVDAALSGTLGVSGNLTANNGTFTNSIGLGSGLITYDPIKDTIRFNKTVVSDFDIVAFTDSGQSLPSIFDNLPKTSKTAFGVVKVGAGINVSGGVISLDIGSIAPQTLSFNGVDNKLSISGGNTVDLSGLTPDLTGYATENWVQLGFKPIAYQPTWGQITGKPSTFAPSVHNHIIGDITGLQGALDGKKPNFSENTAFNKNFGTDAGTVAQGNDSRINNGQTAYGWGNHASIDYARKGQNETITGAWTINNNLRLGGGTTRNLYTGSMRIRDNGTGAWIISPESGAPARWYFRPDGDGAFTNTFFISQGGVGFGTEDPQERLHVVGNGLFTGNLSAVDAALSGTLGVSGNLTANNGTFTNSIGLGSGLITYDPIKDTIRFNKTVVSDFDIVAFTDSGQSLPSIFDNLPKTSKTAFGVVKVGAGINVSGGVISLDIGSIAPQTLSFNGVDNKLSISGGNTVDLSGLTPDLTGYATENWVQLGFKPIAYQPTWGQITGKPSTFAPSVHNHIIGDITGLQGALDGKKPNFSENTAFNKNFGTAAGTVARGNDSRINNGQTAYGWGNHASIDYARKGQNEVITGAWTIQNQGSGYRPSLRMKTNSATSGDDTGIDFIVSTVDNVVGARIRVNRSSGGYGSISLQNRTSQDADVVDRLFISSANGNVGINYTAPTEKLHVVGNGLFTGNLTANNGTFTTGLKIGTNDVATESWVQNTGTAYNSLRLGGVVASDYVRRNVAETITGGWNFSNNIGIGQANPTEKLHVVGNGLFTGNIYSTGLMKVTHLSPRYEFHQTDVQNACRWVLDNDLIQMQVIEYGTSLFSHTPFTISLNAPNDSFRVNSTGSVTTGSDLYVGGNLTAQGEVTAYSSSDIRLKKNIKTIESAIDTINKLNPVQFNWNEKAIELNSAKDSDRVNYGVIAQEIERVLPDLVHQTNGYKSVDYIQLIGVLLASVKELNNKITRLENKL